MTVSITSRFWWFALVIVHMLLSMSINVVWGQTTPEVDEPGLRQFSGWVIQGTDGAALPSELVVTLHIFDASFEEQTLETRSSPIGEFVFEDVPVADRFNYFVSTEYLGQLYAAPSFRGDPVSVTDDLSIVVHELTSDPAQIQIVEISTRIDLPPNQPDLVRVVRSMTFSNISDRLYVGSAQLDDGQPAVLEVGLPVGAIVVELEAANRFVFDEERFTLIGTRPLTPGEGHEVHVVYLMPYRDAAIIEYPVQYAFNGPMRVLLGTEVLEFSSEQLAPIGTETVDDRQFLVYGRSLTLSPGDLIRYDLTGRLPSDSGAEAVDSRDIVDGSSSNRLVTFVAGAITLLFGVAIVVVFLSRDSENNDERVGTIQDLLHRIKELDGQHDSGQINHDLYHRQRAELQAQLEDLTDPEPMEHST